MCGFSVFVGATTDECGATDPEWQAQFANAVDSLSHRGPDDSTIEFRDGNAWGFKRLAVIDLDESRQPIHYPVVGPDAERWTVVCNGEIYNYRELRTELIRDNQAVFATHGDVEVLAAAFHYWGPAALHRLRGMFACVLWDSANERLYAARDPFGIKPLHYLPMADGLLLASEQQALLPFARHGTVDQAALSYFLTLQYVPEPATLHPDIRRLEAGRLLTQDRGGEPTITRYFRPDFRPADLTLNEAVGSIRAAMRDSVRAHMRADVPVGAFLSSGIDSTAVVALARELKPDLLTFTAGFADAAYSEIDVAEDTARQLGVTHIPTVISPIDVIRELPRILWHLDDPVADPSLVPLYFLAGAAAQHVTVVLSGEGADELFGGYEIYREPASLASISRLPAPMQRGLRTLSTVMPEGMRGKSFLDRGTTPIEERYYGNARIFGPAERALLMRGSVAPHTDVTAHLYREAADLDDSTTMQYIDLHTWLTGDILTKADRISMAHSLELRVPFLDPVVYAAAAQLPTSLKLPPGERTTKHALREAMRSVVPASVVDRRKLGFPTPTRAWLRGEIGEWAGDVFAASGAHDLLDLGYAQQLLAEHRGGEADHARKIWTVFTFCLWHAMAIEKTLDPGVAVPAARAAGSAPGRATAVRTVATA
jgi:asparagine synthase (glutamine-hydrolysing)